MTTHCTGYGPPKGGSGLASKPDSREDGQVSSRDNPRDLLRGDPFHWLIVRHPLFVGAVFLIFGWGTLLLQAWRLDVITDSFLRNPSFMVGDLILLPLCGALMASFYRASGRGMTLDLGRWLALGSALIASVAAGLTAVFSIYFTESYHGVWSVPHTLFIWFFAYTFVLFLPRAFILMAFALSMQGMGKVALILLMPAAHIALKTSLGGSLP